MLTLRQKTFFVVPTSFYSVTHEAELAEIIQSLQIHPCITSVLSFKHEISNNNSYTRQAAHCYNKGCNIRVLLHLFCKVILIHFLYLVWQE